MQSSHITVVRGVLVHAANNVLIAEDTLMLSDTFSIPDSYKEDCVCKFHYVVSYMYTMLIHSCLYEKRLW